MQTKTHTPGPWKSEGGHVTAGDVYIGYLTDFGPEDDALATAAPELLEACKDLLQSHRLGMDVERATKQAQAAIARAEGRA